MSTSEFIGIEELSALNAWVRATAKGYYRVRFDASAPTAYVTNRGEMVIPQLNAKVTKRDRIRLRGWCLHETSHPRYQPESFKIILGSKLNANSPLLAIYNMFLDVHGETSRAQEWPGDEKALIEFGVVTGRDVTDNLSEKLDKAGTDLPEDFIKTSAVMYAAVKAESTWNRGLDIGFAKLFADCLPDEVIEIGNDIRTKFDLDRRLPDTTQNEHQIWELAKEVFEYLFGRTLEEEQKQNGKGKGEGEKEEGASGEDPSDGGEEGDGESDEPSDEDGDQEGKPKDKDGKDKDAKKKPKDKLKIKELVWSSHYETSTKEKKASGVGFDYSGHTTYHTYVPIPFDEFRIVEF